ncbi:MAG: hypothetical protein EOM88_03810 [Clostridia bacterium]|nr:hypothetical protein [Clostridia bacterium]
MGIEGNRPFRDGLKDNLRNKGHEFAFEEKLEYLLPEDWFSKYYQGQSYEELLEELPKHLKETCSKRRIMELIETYRAKSE